MTRFSSVRLLTVAILAVAIELTIVEKVAFRGGRPELLLVLACFAALFAADMKQGLGVAWTLGLVKDVGSSLPLGFHSLLFVAAAWAILHLRQLVFREHPFMQAAIVFASVLAMDLVVASFVCLFHGAIPFGVIAVKALSGAIFSALLAPVVMFLLLRWRSFLRGA